MNACPASSSSEAGVAAAGDTAEGAGASAAHAVENSRISPSATLTTQGIQFAAVRVRIITFPSLPVHSAKPSEKPQVKLSTVSPATAFKVRMGIIKGLYACRKPPKSETHFQLT